MWTSTLWLKLQDTVLFGTVIYYTLYKNWFENMSFVFWLNQYSNTQLDNIMFNTSLSTFRTFWLEHVFYYIGTREYHHGKTVLVSTYVFIYI